MIKKFISVTCSLSPLPLSQTVTPSRTPPPSSATYFMDGPLEVVPIGRPQKYLFSYLLSLVHMWLTPTPCGRPHLALGAVHKVLHAIFGQFFPPPPLCHTSRDPPRKYVTHLGPPIFSRPSTKIPDKSPLYKFYLNCSQRFLSGGL